MDKQAAPRHCGRGARGERGKQNSVPARPVKAASQSASSLWPASLAHLAWRKAAACCQHCSSANSLSFQLNVCGPCRYRWPHLWLLFQATGLPLAHTTPHLSPLCPLARYMHWLLSGQCIHLATCSSQCCLMPSTFLHETSLVSGRRPLGVVAKAAPKPMKLCRPKGRELPPKSPRMATHSQRALCSHGWRRKHVCRSARR